MKNRGARSGRRTLVSTCWLLLLTGLSCKYNVTLPWVPEDASTQTQDSAFDQSSSYSPDLPLPVSDARACPGNKAWRATRAPAQLIVAVDRSTLTQKDLDFTSTLSALVGSHPGISFWTTSFPWTNCGGTACCASPVVSAPSKAGPPDASGVCGPSDAGCLSPSNDSPSHHALKKVSQFVSSNWFARWNSTVVLMTDQNPSCAGESPSSGNACDIAVNEAAKLSEMGVRTFVVVPGADGRATPDCLSRIAKSSSEAQQLVTVKSSQDMRVQLDQIANGIEEKLCRFYLPEMVDPGQVEWVEIGGIRIDRDETGKTGWKLTPYGGAILLSAEECKKTEKIAVPDVEAITCGPGYGQGHYGS